MLRKRIRVGDLYQDCAYHPVFCTEVDGDDISGISLMDGSGPRSCSLKHCAPIRIRIKDIDICIIRAKNAEELMKEYWFTKAVNRITEIED